MIWMACIIRHNMTSRDQKRSDLDDDYDSDSDEEDSDEGAVNLGVWISNLIFDKYPAG